MEVEIRKHVEEAANQAKTDPELPVEELYNSVIVDPPADMRIRGSDISIQAKTRP